MLYRYGPNLSDPRWTWLFPGNVLAAIAWLAVSALFSWYIARFGNYDATYGSLGGAIGMMTWMWISTIVVLLGAELNAELGACLDNSGLWWRRLLELDFVCL